MEQYVLWVVLMGLLAQYEALTEYGYSPSEDFNETVKESRPSPYHRMGIA